MFLGSEGAVVCLLAWSFGNIFMRVWFRLLLGASGACTKRGLYITLLDYCCCGLDLAATVCFQPLLSRRLLSNSTNPL